jgi:uncharacterized oxidoreductase
MKTIFITGANSGIGSGLARALHARGARVVLGGRNREALEAAAAQLPGAEVCVVDVANPTSVAACAKELEQRFPDLDTLINNAGIQRLISLSEPLPTEALDAEIDTNLKGLVAMSVAVLPLLRRQPRATLVQVGSGLGFVPLVSAPLYSATKAAVHAFTVSLREQLRGSTVKVVELIPPVVETSLHRGQARKPPRAMPLDRFVRAALAGFDAGDEEVTVGLARVLRIGARIAPGRFLKIVNKPR